MASDSFTRSNETPLAAPWTKQAGSDFNLSSNAVVSAASNDSYWYYSGSASSADQYCEAVEVSIPSHDWGPAVRINGAGNTGTAEGYFYSIWSNQGNITKHVNGSFTSIASANLSSYAVGDVVRIEAEGTTLRAYQDGVSRGTTTDSSLTGAGNGAGIFIYEAGGSGVDDWDGGDLGGSSTPVSATVAVDYDIANAITKTVAVDYDIANAVSAEVAVDYDIANAVSAEVAVDYDIANAVSRTVAIPYDILAAADAVSATVAVDYDIANAVSAEVAVDYDIANAVSAEVAVDYDLINAISAECYLIYDLGDVVITAVPEAISATRAAIWQPDKYTSGKRQ